MIFEQYLQQYLKELGMSEEGPKTASSRMSDQHTLKSGRSGGKRQEETLT